MDRTAVRIAMWSGPRNVSTAMMRAWENRPDTVVVDEPLYAHYLAETGIDHPGREVVLARHESDWRRVAANLTGPLPDGISVCFQKHMAHHLLPSVGREWLAAMTHAFLIRDPAEMLASYAKIRPEITLADTGLPQQVEMLHAFGGHGRGTRGDGYAAPAVVDARDLLFNPEAILRALCNRLDVAFTERMLSWPPGLRPTDGAWAPWWYTKVEHSTGFTPWTGSADSLPPRLEPLLERCRPYYEELHALRLTTRQ
jgi:Sulfotransferase domain